MAKVLVTQSKLDTLAEIVGGKSNTNVPLTIDEMITAADSITSGGGITPSGNINITSAGVTDVTNYATATVPQGSIGITTNGYYRTENGTRYYRFNADAGVDSDNDFGAEGYIADDTIVSGYFDYNAIPKNTTITPSTSSQTIGGANYMMEGAVTVSAMPSGSAGTPTATKGAVNNHAISVTPSVTNTTGYITGGTKTGTAVSVSASDVCSGSETKTANGTYDVTNLAQLVVNVSGGTSKNVQVLQSTSRTNSSSLTKVLGDLTVSKTGTYDIYWSGGRTNTSTSYTWGTRLYVDGSGYGTENTSWTNNCQSNHLSNVSLTANQKLSVYARGRTGSYYTFAPMLVIVEV